ncbi:bifunctional phosphopantothenoylcysteine decarboxylase/phosphopantothenate--cysteine ligase CoaBC [Meiothermus ruber]|jgi:phosphopantothenoylcysteine decarboxylase/phosphopantothenate--cysteine ligase|uniref:Coenzyme A biosynthesis bifunctional protein CoaBC n=1 Tax=Meiothermus ruber (strain ATCC 35948 / DSM 1279 / VKM B-1258 / 21) TaxID=504728 RepID=D3PTL9_MEIRD|nr:bifunctional phosphopantothenoylcysteine decarboxylase/phosphopantothenate--cysteine ligase CoaBC [Meiothermus ruber]ADD28802.1 phosphopantothenoylcysteine decarboxylase/phosphopantothenate/cysteine ligase [Meiothermus ruber DSM 1279]AGK05749.1 phosphopantothenoylcysteine decarboxylase/phosphopantothenate--cysteine ligase [Meiothermus ruber DSM 1279]MCL6529445.1 bifunctional phosphopantothenoylcysteine decarboxylase/phosphopantothenate--cysteine ligase CoaBC [Meiothermus ruber]MCX7801501.1 b
MNPLQGKRIVLGVSGSIAAYKAADLASKLTQAGALVDVILSEGAERFITPLTFASLTGRRAYASLWEGEAHVLHVGLGEAADLLVIAPCTAHTLAKLAQGQADNLLTLTALAARCPVLVAPAMDGGMFEHPATQANLETLRRRGVQILGPAQGRMASGLVGLGRMLEPAEILGQIRLALGRGGPLAGKHVVVSAGGTQEPLDPVRYLTNRSSGKQGFALAQAALDLGARVSLVVGATAAALPTPTGAERTDVETAAQMAEAVLRLCREADVLIMAAAVADFRPRQVRAHKIKKEREAPQLELEPTPDILLAVAEERRHLGRPAVVVGFAAESEKLRENAQDKLERKSLSMIVANDISAPDAGFAVDTNRVLLLLPGGVVEPLPLMTKGEVAAAVLARVVGLLAEGAQG